MHRALTVIAIALAAPFFTQAEHKVPDNWWHDAS